MAWHYRAAPPGLGFTRSRELVNVLNDMSRSFDFQIIEGSKVLEVRPMGVDKGAAAKRLLQERPADMVVAIGDDRTDEDLFKALPIETLSLRVGMVPSFARYNLRAHEDVLSFLSALARVRSPKPAKVV